MTRISIPSSQNFFLFYFNNTNNWRSHTHTHTEIITWWWIPFIHVLWHIVCHNHNFSVTSIKLTFTLILFFFQSEWVRWKNVWHLSPISQTATHEQNNREFIVSNFSSFFFWLSQIFSNLDKKKIKFQTLGCQ